MAGVYVDIGTMLRTKQRIEGNFGEGFNLSFENRQIFKSANNS